MKFNYRNETTSISDFRKQFNISDKVTYVKKLARNTFEYNINGILKVRLYETDILEHKSKSIILNNGGFNSRLTQNRLNDILSSIFQIYYKEPENYNIPHICTIKGNWYYIDKYGIKYRFFGGIEISKKTSKVINLKNSPNFNKEDRKKIRAVKKYFIYNLIK